MAQQATANQLRCWRQHAGLTMHQLAENIGSSATLVCKLERGRVALSGDVIARLAAGLGVSPGLLLDRTPGGDRALLLHLIDNLSERQRQEALAVLRALRDAPDLTSTAFDAGSHRGGHGGLMRHLWPHVAVVTAGVAANIISALIERGLGIQRAILRTARNLRPRQRPVTSDHLLASALMDAEKMALRMAGVA